MRRVNCIFTAIKSIKNFRRENYLVGLSTSLQSWCNMADIKTKTPLIQSFFINIGAPIAGIFADHPNILGVCFRHSVPIHRVLNSVLSTISSLYLFQLSHTPCRLFMTTIKVSKRALDFTRRYISEVKILSHHF